MNHRGLRPLARTFRKEPTPAEAKAWELLRDRRLLGFKFRRQHPLKGCIVDFYCHELRLIIEVDGSVHESQKQHERDCARDTHLENSGFSVIRIPNDLMIRERLVAAVSPRIAERG